MALRLQVCYNARTMTRLQETRMRSAAKPLTSVRSATRIALTLLIALGVVWAGWASAANSVAPPSVRHVAQTQPPQPQVINPPVQGTGLPNQTGILVAVLLLVALLIIGESLRSNVPPQYVPPPPEHHDEGHQADTAAYATAEPHATEHH
jgi:hypothetical protein